MLKNGKVKTWQDYGVEGIKTGDAQGKNGLRLWDKKVSGNSQVRSKGQIFFLKDAGQRVEKFMGQQIWMKRENLEFRFCN